MTFMTDKTSTDIYFFIIQTANLQELSSYRNIIYWSEVRRKDLMKHRGFFAK